MSARGYSQEQLEIIRTMAVDTPDHVIGERLGFHARKVAYIRQWNSIPAFNRRSKSGEKAELIRRLYVDQGLSSSAVAEMVGCAPGAVRRLKGRMGWHRDPAIEARNREELNRRMGASRVGRPAKRAAPPPVAKAPPNLAKAPVIFKKEPEVREPLDVRIAREISRRPMTAQSIATVLGEKELTVSMQLSALLHGGQVEASGEGRNKLWRPSLCALSKFTNRSESMGCGGAVTPAAS